MSIPEFEIGEIAIYIKPGSPVYGMEVKILSSLYSTRSKNIKTGQRRSIEAYNITNIYPGLVGRFMAKPKYLRKKKKEKASWENIEEVTGWNPTNVMMDNT